YSAHPEIEFGGASDHAALRICGAWSSICRSAQVWTLIKEKKMATSNTPTFTVLVNFSDSNGVNPNGGLIIDAAGDLFGTTTSTTGSNGPYFYSTVFEIAKTAGGYASTQTMLVSFNGIIETGAELGLIDGAGDLFGTTVLGGSIAA